ncbi:MAG: ABC transporter substrate-binding protein/permease [Acutalibacteraceae bacterium]
MIKKKKRSKLFVRFVGMMLLAALLTFTLTAYATGSQSDSQESSQTEDIIKSVDDLPGKTIGVQLGTTGDTYATDYEGDEAGTKIERYNKAADAVQALKQQKIDCVIIDDQPANEFLKKNSDIKKLDEDFSNEDYAFCVKKGRTELLDKINASLDKLKKDGTLANIITNYIGTDEQKGTMPYEKKNVDRSNGKIVVATNAEFKPYEYYENGVVTGIDIDIMQAICDDLGMEMQIEDMQFDSIIVAVQSGKADVGAAGMTVTEDRKKNVDFSDSYTNAKQVILVRNTDNNGGGMGFIDKLKQSFVDDSRWQYILTGLKNTLIITLFAILIGLVLGSLIAIVRTVHDQNGKLKILNFICKIYLTIIRGTPAMIQLLIIYYVIFASVTIDKTIVAVVAFGLNSAAYVAEVVRSGINSVDHGQFEAGRSLGLNYKQTMWSIILPQAFRNMLPALCNEFISLLKETAISGYIGLNDLTKGGDIIRSQTFEAFIPLIAVALIYLAIVMLLTFAVNKLERKLKNNEIR